MTTGPVEALLAADHARLGALLDAAVADARRFDAAAYAEFRRGILRHIAVEERVLLRRARERRGGEPLPCAAGLRVEHSAIAALLVPPPDHAIVAELRAILEPHDAKEEGPHGMYAEVEALLHDDLDALVQAVRDAPWISVAPHIDAPGVYRTAEAALRMASRK